MSYAKWPFVASMTVLSISISSTTIRGRLVFITLVE
jgi:hypothetical protein